MSVLSSPAAANSFPALPLTPDAAAGRKLRLCVASFDFVGPVKNGGVGTAFTSLACALADAGHEVTCLYLAGDWCENQTLDHWIAHYKKKGIRFVPLPASGLRINSRWHVNKAYEGYLWLKQQRFDVVHFSEWKGPGYFAMRAKNQGLAFADTLLCVHTHGPTLWHKLSNAEYITSLDDVELDYLERQSVRLADVVVSPSQYLLRWMLERGWVLPTQCFVQQYVRPGTAREPKPGADTVQPIDELVFFGRLEVRKGLVLFCDALDRLSDELDCRGAKVTFLGKADKVAGLSSSDYVAQRAKNWPWLVQIVSDRDQAGAMDYLQGPGRLAVVPSLVDNLPNTVLECLGAQVPILASDAGGIPEMIAADDLAATTFPLKAGALAAKLRGVLQAGIRPARYAVNQRENEQAWVRWHEGLVATPATAPLATVQPLVSVCMSHWNRPDYLRQALASIEAQDYPHYEVVLIDDGSTTAEAHALLAELEPLFAARGWQLLRNAENTYPGAARNRAARHARGDYILFMDDDNCAKPYAISTFVGVARRTEADIVTCCLDTFTGRAAPHAGLKPTQRWLFLGDDVATGAFRNNFGDTNGLWRREVFLGTGGFHEDWGVGHEDWELLAKAVLKGARLQVVPDPLAWYRLNEGEATVNRKTPLHANHMANIRPYLDAVPPPMRNLMLYAQGASVRLSQPLVDEQTMKQIVQMHVMWRSKLEAALALLERGQEKVAAKLMLDAVKAVQDCKHVPVILEALLEVSMHLGKLDAGRARYLLTLAADTATKMGRAAELERARRLLAELPAVQRSAA
jgi:GT2 family glycosyltransferase/glycosyltransferase involved in cell wall biosynthesis